MFLMQKFDSFTSDRNPNVGSLSREAEWAIPPSFIHGESIQDYVQTLATAVKSSPYISNCEINDKWSAGMDVLVHTYRALVHTVHFVGHSLRFEGSNFPLKIRCNMLQFPGTKCDNFFLQ